MSDKPVLVVRAITAADLEPMLEMAAQVGSGMTTLKPDRKMLGDRIAVAVQSFAETIAPEKRDYMFVMEDTRNGRLAGVCAIKASVGLDEPFYNYRIGNTGKWLSKCRFLFIAQFPHLFTAKMIAEMRGYQEEDGRSPFYEGLGRHFFKMDFNHVDNLTAMGKKSFIAELMPRQPLYVEYLPQDAREVIGKVHTSTAPARRLLEQEGMHYEGYVDIFDAGPVLQGRVSELRAVRDSTLTLAEEAVPQPGDEPTLVSNTVLQDFRMIVATATPSNGRIALSHDELALLHCHGGEQVRTLSLNARKNAHV
jgi:arginine N-succinyltransferase